MTTLVWPQLDQQVITAVLDEAPIVRCERPNCQQGMNRFACVDEIGGLFTNIKHGGIPYEEKDKECGKECIV